MPAPLIFRTLAFFADSVLVLVAALFVLKIYLPIFCPDGFSTFVDYVEKFSVAYNETLASAAAGTVSSARLDAVSAAAAQDVTLFSFFETINAVSLVVAVLYFVLTEYFGRGQTLGKKIFGLRTVAAGTRDVAPTFFQTFSRALWKAISLVPAGVILLLLAIINAHVVFFSRRHRGWHDKLSRTEVIDTRERKK